MRWAHARGAEEHALTVGRPAAHAIGTGVIRQAYRVAAGRRHDVHVHVSADSSRVGDHRSVGRKARLGLDGGCRRQPSRLATGARDGPQVARVLERDELATDGGVTQEASALCRDRRSETDECSA